MCGRTGLTLKRDTLRCACSYKQCGTATYKQPKWVDEHNDGREYTPSYNIAPTQVTPVLVSGAVTSRCDDRVLKPMMWGMIPPWHKGDYRNHNLSTNNCRLENIKVSKLYGTALREGGRCVIVVEGFYEWQTTDKQSKSKQPYYIYAPQDKTVKMDDPSTWLTAYDEINGWKGIRLLHMAGVYSVWHGDDTVMYSYSIITMESNSTMDWMHHRMPAILDTEEQINVWLNIKEVNSDMALTYLRPVKILSWHPVSTMVNNSRNKSDECNKRISLQTPLKQKPLTEWFSKAAKRKPIDKDDESSNNMKKTKTQT